MFFPSRYVLAINVESFLQVYNINSKYIYLHWREILEKRHFEFPIAWKLNTIWKNQDKSDTICFNTPFWMSLLSSIHVVSKFISLSSFFKSSGINNPRKLYVVSARSLTILSNGMNTIIPVRVAQLYLERSDCMEMIHVYIEIKLCTMEVKIVLEQTSGACLWVDFSFNFL